MCNMINPNCLSPSCKGNLDSKRDWGHAKDYVRMMWMMLQCNLARLVNNTRIRKAILSPVEVQKWLWTPQNHPKSTGWSSYFPLKGHSMGFSRYTPCSDPPKWRWWKVSSDPHQVPFSQEPRDGGHVISWFITPIYYVYIYYVYIYIYLCAYIYNIHIYIYTHICTP